MLPGELLPDLILGLLREPVIGRADLLPVPQEA
jgi:hypothetical protein